MKKFNKTLGFNGIINIISTIIGLLVPFIYYPYVLRILGPENYGVFTFSEAFAYYFTVLATLGIKIYAGRELAAHKTDLFFCKSLLRDVFLISLITTSFSLVLYLAIIFLNNAFSDEKVLYMVMGFYIIFSGLNIEWYYSGKERFDLVAIRNIGSKLAMVLLVFVTIKNPSDYCIFAICVVSALYGLPMMFNYIGLLFDKDLRNCSYGSIGLKKHLQPIFFLSLMTIGSNLFSGVDKIMLKIMADNTAVGLYDSAIKLPVVFDSIIYALSAVLIPRLAFHANNNDYNGMNESIGKIGSAALFISIPAVLSCCFFSKEIILIFAGESYLSSSSALMIYSFVIVTTLFASICGREVLVALKKEKLLFIFLLISGVVNLFLNLLLIPIFSYNGAALATVISNIVYVILMMTSTVKYRLFTSIFNKHSFCYLIGALVIGIAFAAVKLYIDLPPIPHLLVAVFIAGVFYIAVEVLFKEKTVSYGINIIKRVLKR